MFGYQGDEPRLLMELLSPLTHQVVITLWRVTRSKPGARSVRGGTACRASALTGRRRVFGSAQYMLDA
jgi:hypothetical protein